MKFNRIEVEAFMAIGSATINLDSKGLVLIQGENLDDSSQNSNGAGKSTLVEALQWALYGETARGDKGDAIVHRTLKKNTRVLVQLVDGDREYNIVRHRKHKDHKNRLLLLDVTDREDIVDMTLGTDKATQELVEKIIGCSAEVFRAAVYSGQEQQIDLPALTDKALKIIVEEAAGIDKLQQAYLIARQKLGQAGDVVTQMEHAVDRSNDAVQRCNEQIEALKAKQAEWDTKQSESIDTLKTYLKAMARDIKEAKTVLDTFDGENLQRQLDKVNSDLSEISSEKEQEQQLNQAIIKASIAVDVATTEFEQDKRKAEKLKLKINDVQSEIGTNCSECGQVIKESAIADRRDALKNQIIQTVEDAKRKKAQLEEAKVTLSNAQHALETFQSSMTDVSDLVDAQNRIQTSLSAMHKQEQTVQNLRDGIKRETSRLDELQAAINPYAELIETEQNKLADSSKQVQEAEDKLSEAKHQRVIAGSVADVFSPAGIRAHILDTVTPFLNDRTAQYLGTLSDGNIQAEWSTQTRTAKGDLREKFGIEVKSSTGGESYRSLSGGEKRKVRLATTLALQDLVSSRASKPIELWIGDEIDDAVDVSGLERLMTVLEEKASEKGTVLVISHNQLSDWVRQHAVVRKENGIATISGVLNLEDDEERV